MGGVEYSLVLQGLSTPVEMKGKPTGDKAQIRPSAVLTPGHLICKAEVWPQVHVLYIEHVVLNQLLNQFFLFFAVFPQLYFHMIHQRRKILSHTEEHKKFE